MITKRIIGIKNLFKNNLNWIDYCICICLSVLIPLSTVYLKTGDISLSSNIIMQFILLFFVLLILTILTRQIFYTLANSDFANKSGFIAVSANKLFQSKHQLLWISLIIFLCWLPSLIMLYPGSLANDSWGQLSQTLSLKDGVWDFSSHHPVLGTIIMSVIIIPIHTLTNDWQLGFFAYVILQAVSASLCFSYSIVYMRKKMKQKKRTSLIFLLIYCFYPIFIASTQTIAKDLLSACFFLLFIIQFIEIIRTGGASLLDKRSLPVFIVTCILCILTKKTSFYIILFSVLPLLVILKRSRKLISLIVLVMASFSLIFIPIVQKTFSIKPSLTREMLSLPFQQSANYIIRHGEEITDHEKSVLENTLDYYNITTQYDPIDADHIKGNSKIISNREYLSYLKTWLIQGIKHPETYIEAAFKQNAGWFSYLIYLPSTDMKHHNQLNLEYMPEKVTERSEFFLSTSQIFNDIYQFIFQIPIIGAVLTFVFVASLLPLFIMATIYHRHKQNGLKYLFACAPVILSLFIGCYLAPQSATIEGVRYLYPILYSSPLLLMLAISLYSKDASIRRNK